MIKITKDVNEEKILNKYIQKRHKLLLFLRDEEDFGNNTTVLEISDKFPFKKETAWKKLRRLEMIGDVKKGKKIATNGNEYFNFTITDKVRQELKIVSRHLYKNYFPNLSAGTVDTIKGDFIKSLKKRIEQVIREFLPEGNRYNALIKKVNDEINGSFAESEP